METADWVRCNLVLALVTCWVSATAMKISSCLKVMAITFPWPERL
jgi:hypothetical protein